jgi:hypothetical protein
VAGRGEVVVAFHAGALAGQHDGGRRAVSAMASVQPSADGRSDPKATPWESAPS